MIMEKVSDPPTASMATATRWLLCGAAIHGQPTKETSFSSWHHAGDDEGRRQQQKARGSSDLLFLSDRTEALPEAARNAPTFTDTIVHDTFKFVYQILYEIVVELYKAKWTIEKYQILKTESIHFVTL
jgi:hypothetical protein